MSRRADLSDWRELMQDGRVAVRLGIVKKPTDEALYYVVTNADLRVWVELAGSMIPKLCRFGSAVGGPDWGVWAIPPEGTEVMVAVADGDLKGECAIVACLSTGDVPNNIQPATLYIRNGATKITTTSEYAGHIDISAALNANITITASRGGEPPANGKVIITGYKVQLGGDSGLQPAVLGNDLKTRLEALENAFNGHTHSSAATAQAISALSPPSGPSSTVSLSPAILCTIAEVK